MSSVLAVWLLTLMLIGLGSSVPSTKWKHHNGNRLQHKGTGELLVPADYLREGHGIYAAYGLVYIICIKGDVNQEKFGVKVGLSHRNSIKERYDEIQKDINSKLNDNILHKQTCMCTSNSSFV